MGPGEFRFFRRLERRLLVGALELRNVRQRWSWPFTPGSAQSVCRMAGQAAGGMMAFGLSRFIVLRETANLFVRERQQTSIRGFHHLQTTGEELVFASAKGPDHNPHPDQCPQANAWYNPH